MTERTELDVLRAELKQAHEDNRRSTTTKRIYAGLLCISILGNVYLGRALANLTDAGYCRADALGEWADDVTGTLRGEIDAADISSLRDAYNEC